MNPFSRTDSMKTVCGFCLLHSLYARTCSRLQYVCLSHSSLRPSSRFSSCNGGSGDGDGVGVSSLNFPERCVARVSQYVLLHSYRSHRRRPFFPTRPKFLYFLLEFLLALYFSTFALLLAFEFYLILVVLSSF